MLYIFFPPRIEFYQLDLTNTGIHNTTYLVEESDLDTDGSPEQIELSAYRTPVIKIRDYQTKGIRQIIPLKGEWSQAKTMTITDVDHDGHKEINTFVVRHDSLFILHIPVRGWNSEPEIRYTYVRPANRFEGKMDLTVYLGDTIDYNQDHYQDLTFFMYAGYTLKPRKMCIYDIRNDSIITSRNFGVQITGINAVYDIDKDGHDEIFARTSASNNYPLKAEMIYPDTLSWLMVFRDDLQLFVPPDSYPASASSVSAVPLVDGPNYYILAQCYSRSDQLIPPEIRVYDLAGKHIRDLPLPVPEANNYSAFYIYPLPETGYTRVLSINMNTNTVMLIGHDLKIISKKLPVSFQQLMLTAVKPEGEGMDFVLTDPDKGTIYLLDENLDHVVIRNLNYIRTDKEGRSPVLHSKDPESFLMTFGNRSHTFKYRRNPWFPFRYAFIPVYYLASLLLVYLIQRPIVYQVRKTRELKADLLNHQLTTTMKQFSPHYTLNALNAIYGAVKNNENETASNYILQFSKLFRIALTDSDKIAVPLKDEVQHMKNFVALEQLRTGNLFDMKVIMNGDLDHEIPVPRLCILNEVENAIKHGISGLSDKRGKIIVEITRNGDKLVMSITDNGIGREKAQHNHRNSTGKGRMMAGRMFTLFNELYNTKFNYAVEDLCDGEGLAAGTRIVITASYERLQKIKA